MLVQGRMFKKYCWGTSLCVVISGTLAAEKSVFNKGFHSDVHRSDMYDCKFFWQFSFVRHSPGDFRKSPYLGVSVCFFYWRPIKTRCFVNVTGLSSAPGPCLFL